MDDTARMTHSLEKAGKHLNDMLEVWFQHDLPSDFLPVGAYPFDKSLEDLVAEVGASVEFLQDDDALPFVRQNPALCKDFTRRDMLDHVLPSAEFHAGGLRVMMRYLDDGWLVKLHDNWGDVEQDGPIVVHRYHPDREGHHAGETETYLFDGQSALKYWLEMEAPESSILGHLEGSPEHAAAYGDRPYLTLGEFREATKHLPDSFPVTAGGLEDPGASDWFNLTLDTVPTTDDGSAGEAPSVILGLDDTFDTRQF